MSDQIKLLQQQESRIHLFMKPQREMLALLFMNPDAWTPEAHLMHLEGTIDRINEMRCQAWGMHIGVRKLEQKQQQ